MLADGPGHLRSTVFPGGAGTSVIMGRATTYGGPFGHITSSARGPRIKVVTQVGTSTFRVIAVRPAGAVRQVPRARSRLTLGTAAGHAVRAVGGGVGRRRQGGRRPGRQRPPVNTVPASRDGPWASTPAPCGRWPLGWWSWPRCSPRRCGPGDRRGHAQAWIVFTAPLLLVWFFVADQVARLLPNLL